MVEWICVAPLRRLIHVNDRIIEKSSTEGGSAASFVIVRGQNPIQYTINSFYIYINSIMKNKFSMGVEASEAFNTVGYGN